MPRACCVAHYLYDLCRVAGVGREKEKKNKKRRKKKGKMLLLLTVALTDLASCPPARAETAGSEGAAPFQLRALAGEE